MTFEAWRRSSLAGGGLGLVVALAWTLGAFGDWDRAWVDFLHRLRGPQRADERVLVVEVDLDTLRGPGPWPWRDAFWTRLFETFERGRVAAVAIEAKVLPSPSGRKGPGRRDMLRAMERLPAVYLSVETPLGIRSSEEGRGAPGLVRPGSDLCRAATALGHDAFEEERVGLLGTRLPRFLVEGKRCYPPLSYLLARHGPRELGGGDLLGYLMWLGPLGSSIPSVSASALLRGDERALAALRGRLVLVGGSAKGFFVRRATPFGDLPDVAVHATVLHGLLTGGGLHGFGPVVVFPGLLLTGLLVGSAGLGRGMAWAWVSALFFLAAFFVTSVWAMVFGAIIVPFVPVVVALFLSAMAVTVDRWIDLRSSLRRERSLSRLTLDHMSIAVFAFDEGGRLGLVNDEGMRFLRRFEIPAGTGAELSLLGETLPEVFRISSVGSRIEEEIRIEVPGTGERTLSIVSMPLSVDGRSEGTILLVEDQTERLALFERLSREDRLVALGRFAAGIVHEIKNPLQTMRNAFEILEEGGAGPDEVELARVGRGEVDRLGELLREILGFARPDLGDVEEKVDLLLVVQGVVAMVVPVFRKQGISLVLDADGGPFFVKGRPQRLTQILLNLVNNASQAIDGEGRIDVSLRRQEKEIHLAVRDSGRGLSAQEIEGLFRPFASSRPDGTGLGLFLVESFVADMGGRIRVESEFRRGTTVWLDFPSA